MELEKDPSCPACGLSNPFLAHTHISYKKELIKKLEADAFVPDLGINQQWTGQAVKYLTLTRAIELIREDKI